MLHLPENRPLAIIELEWIRDGLPKATRNRRQPFCYFSGDAGEFRMYLWQTTALSNGVLSLIERSKDSSGNKTADYVTVITGSANSVNAEFCQSFNGTNQAPLLNSAGAVVAAVSERITTGNSGSTTASYPAFPLVPPTAQLGNPFLGMVVLIAADTADGATITVSAEYAGTHTYIVAKQNSFTSSFFAQAGYCPAMRYE